MYLFEAKYENQKTGEVIKRTTTIMDSECGYYSEAFLSASAELCDLCSPHELMISVELIGM